MFILILKPEGAGWLKVQVGLDGESWDFTASDLGPDLCEQLLFASTRLIEKSTEGPVAATIEMYGEPELLTVYITEEEENIILRLYYLENADIVPKGELGECLKKIQSSSSEISETVYRALRRLLLDHGLEYLSAEWQ